MCLFISLSGCKDTTHTYTTYSNVTEIKDFRLNQDLTYYDKICNNDENILLIWASWCPNCEKVIDYIKENESVFENNVFTISVDEEVADLNEHKTDFPIYLDNNFVIYESLNLEHIPVVYIVDSNGMVIGSSEGGSDCVHLLEQYKKFH